MRPLRAENSGETEIDDRFFTLQQIKAIVNGNNTKENARHEKTAASAGSDPDPLYSQETV